MKTKFFLQPKRPPMQPPRMSAAALLLLVAACAPRVTTLPLEENYGGVAVLHERCADGEVLGRMSTEDNRRSSAMKQLAKRAAALGANSLVVEETTHRLTTVGKITSNLYTYQVAAMRCGAAQETMR